MIIVHDDLLFIAKWEKKTLKFMLSGGVFIINSLRHKGKLVDAGYNGTNFEVQIYSINYS